MSVPLVKKTKSFTQKTRKDFEMNLTDPTPVYRYRATYVSNYDGDTIRVNIG